jgi:hypothetical protein
MGKLYVVKLTCEEREALETLTRNGKSYAWKIERTHARIKLKYLYPKIKT